MCKLCKRYEWSCGLEVKMDVEVFGKLECEVFDGNGEGHV